MPSNRPHPPQRGSVAPTWQGVPPQVYLLLNHVDPDVGPVPSEGIRLTSLFDCLAHIAATEDWHVITCLDHFVDDEVGDALHPPALQMLVAIVEMLVVLARPEWGEPVYRFPGQRPKWMELYLYPNGVPTTLRYLVGWKRQNRRGRPMAVFAYIDEHDGGHPGSWGLALVLGVHELEEERGLVKRRSRPAPSAPVSRSKKVKKAVHRGSAS